MEIESNAPNVIVRGRSVLAFPDLVTAGKYYLEEYFINWVKQRAICIVPPIPWTAYNRVLGPQLKPEHPLIVDGKERGDNAELLIYKMFFAWGEKHNEPMFIIAQVDYDPDNKSKKTSSVLSAFLPDSKQQQLALVSKKMDIDLVIVHTNIGAVIVEIKAAASPLSVIGDTVSSLRKGENLMRLFCNEIFPIYKVALFPNCLSDSLPEGQIAEISRLEEKNDFLFLDSALAEKPETMSRVFEKLKLLTQEKGHPDMHEINTLLYWLISLKCLISSTMHDRKVSKVSLADDTISTSKQVKMTDTKLVQHDVYSKADQKSSLVKKVPTATEVLYLNPEQIAIWDGPKQQLIQGVAGTGKTVLIQHKVLHLDKTIASDEKIIVIATDAVSNIYKKFFHHNGASDRVMVYSKANLLLGKEVISSAHHIFVDETQNILETADFITTVSKNRSTTKYLWISLDPVQALEKMATTIQQLAEELNIPCLPPLKHVMRCTPEVTHFWSKHLPVDCPVHHSQGNRLFVQDVPYYHADNNDQAVSIIHELLMKFVDGKNICYKDCAVLIHSPVFSIIPIRKSLLAKLGWPDEQEYFLKSDEDKITIKDMPNDIWSLEWSYVFLVAQDAKISPTKEELDARLNKMGYWDSGVYLASSRCKVQLFLISMEKGKRIPMGLEPMYLKPERVTFSFKK